MSNDVTIRRFAERVHKRRVLVHSSGFRGATWEGSVLRIDLGSVALGVERERD